MDLTAWDTQNTQRDCYNVWDEFGEKKCCLSTFRDSLLGTD